MFEEFQKWRRRKNEPCLCHTEDILPLQMNPYAAIRVLDRHLEPLTVTRKEQQQIIKALRSLRTVLAEWKTARGRGTHTL